MDLLIADDDAITRLSLRRLFEAEGYQCAEAEDGPEAVEIARAYAPRLVLLDVMMPGLDGFSVARLLRSDARTSHVPILFLTGRDDRSARSRARLAGDPAEIEFVTKPCDDYQLVDVVNIMLRCDHEHDGGKHRVALPQPHGRPGRQKHVH